MATREEITDLYNRLAPVVLRRAQTILGSADEAKDVLQEIFVRLLRQPERLDASQPAVTFLYRCTTNHCLNYIRDRSNRARILDANASLFAPNGTPGLSELAFETSTLVRSILQHLTPQAAAIYIYYHVDGMSHAEIAEMIGCSRRKIGYTLEQIQHQVRNSVPATDFA